MAKKKTDKQLLKSIEEAKKEVVIGGLYSHHKSKENMYVVLDLIIDEESTNVAVVYQALYGDMLKFVRKFEVFTEEVKKGQKRFTLIKQEESK